jgi:glycosyltransferase involved in cell wall biosynthesis
MTTAIERAAESQASGEQDSVELSVIIPCFNAEATIAVQLEALAAQQWSRRWEVVVSDNGSTDRSMDVVRRYAGRLPGLRIVNASRRRNPSHARNVAIRAAAGRLLALCDADDEVEPGWVAALGDALLEHDYVAGQPCFDKFNTREENDYWAPLWEGGIYKKSRFLPGTGAGNIGVRRSAHDAVGGFDETLPRFMDADYSWRLQLAGYRIHFAPKARYQYRIGRVKPSLPYQFRRGWTAPAASYWTYKKYRSLGVTKDMIIPSYRTMKQSSLRWLRTVRVLPRVLVRAAVKRDVPSVGRWLEGFVMQSGEAIGQVVGAMRNPCTPYDPDQVRISLAFDRNQGR